MLKKSGRQEHWMDEANIIPSAKKTNVAADEEEFKANLCLKPFDHKKFSKKFCFTDKMILIPAECKVIGKGVNLDMSSFLIYLERGNKKYFYNEEGAESEKFFLKIPLNSVFVVIGDSEKVFVILKDSEKKPEVFLLPNDVNFSVYLETQQYKKRNRYYACAVRDSKSGFCMCDVTTSPRTAEIYFRLVADMINEN